MALLVINAASTYNDTTSRYSSFYNVVYYAMQKYACWDVMSYPLIKVFVHGGVLLWRICSPSVNFVSIMHIGSLVEIDKHVCEITQLCNENTGQPSLQVLRFATCTVLYTYKLESTVFEGLTQSKFMVWSIKKVR